MEQGRFESDRNRLISSERMILELYLLVYLIVFIGGDTPLGLQFLWLLMATVAGVITYVVFSKVEYSTGIGLLIAAAVSAPLFFVKFQLFILFIVFIYAFWRIHANFSELKSNGWPFLVLNTIMFTVSYFLTIIYIYTKVDILLVGEIIIFLVTIALYFVIRFTIIGLIGRRLHHFTVVDAGKVFGGLLITGAVTFVVVFYFIESVRSGIIAFVGLLFAGLFMGVVKGIIDPIWGWFIKRLNEKRAELLEEDPDYYFVDFSLQDEVTVFGANSSAVYEMFTAIALIIALIVVIMVMRKKKKNHSDSDQGSLFRSGGRKKDMKKNSQLMYDYSDAADTVRKAFKEFEEVAQSSSAPRLRGETVKEWFSRMGWGQNEALFTTYDQVRYGSYRVTEGESNHFVEELEKIKNKFFLKNV